MDNKLEITSTYIYSFFPKKLGKEIQKKEIHVNTVRVNLQSINQTIRFINRQCSIVRADPQLKVNNRDASNKLFEFFKCHVLPILCLTF